MIKLKSLLVEVLKGLSGYIGIIDKYRGVQAKPTYYPDYPNNREHHNEFANALATSWRYNTYDNIVTWNEEPEDWEKALVEDWLIRKGQKVRDHENLFSESVKKSLLTEKTLYHGTTVANLLSIEKIGLMPNVGEFVKDAYDMSGYGENIDPDDYLKDLVFATDKKQLSAAVIASTAQIAYQMGKNFHSVTDDEFYHKAAIIKIYDGESVFQHRPKGDENYYGEHPYTVEPGDYYTENSVIPDEILTGQRMIRLLKRYEAWPRSYPFAKGEKSLRGELMRLALKYHKDTPKEKIMKAVMALSTDQLLYKVNSYRKATGHREEP